MEHTCDNTVNGREKTVQKRAVIQKQRTEFLGNGKDTVSMGDIDDLKGHRGDPVNGIHVTAGRTKTGMTTERNKFEISAGRAGIHDTTKRRVPIINHFFYIFDDRVTRMLNI